MVCEFEKRAENLGHSSLVKEKAKYVEEMGLHLQLEYQKPTRIMHDNGKVKNAEKLKAELRGCLEQRSWDAVHEQNWQGKLIPARHEDKSSSLNVDGCFWWLSSCKQCTTHTVSGMFEIHELFLPTRLYACQKTYADATGEVMCGLCNKAPESVAHILAGCTALAQKKHMTQHNGAPKVLFYEILQDQGLLNSVPPWYLPLKPKPV